MASDNVSGSKLGSSVTLNSAIIEAIKFKEVLKKIGSIYTEQRIEITKQSPLIIKNLELKKSSVVSQNLDSILQILISN